MTNEEVKKYINQIAFSGAVDFLEKYKDKTDKGSQIIGHFGLGFYSAFMVSERLHLGYPFLHREGAQGGQIWSSIGGTEVEMDQIPNRTGREAPRSRCFFPKMVWNLFIIIKCRGNIHQKNLRFSFWMRHISGRRFKKGRKKKTKKEKL